MRYYVRKDSFSRKRTSGKSAFIKGVGRILDTSGSYNKSSYFEISGLDGDVRATASDWAFVGKDMLVAIKEIQKMRDGEEKIK